MVSRERIASNSPSISDLAHDPDLKSLQDPIPKPVEEEAASKAPETSTAKKEEEGGGEKKASSAGTSDNATATTAPTITTTTTATASATSETEKKPTVIQKQGSNFKYTPITFEKSSSSTKSQPSTTTAATKPASPSPKPASPTASGSNQVKSELEKKIERAKRFGVPLDEQTKKQLRAERFGIPLDEKTKRELRAQRFGTGNQGSGKKSNVGYCSGSCSDDGTNSIVLQKGIDPEILKKRAQRFGIPVKDAAAEEEKKRKRAERFGLNTVCIFSIFSFCQSSSIR